MSLSLTNSHCKKGNIFTWIVVPSPVLSSRPEAERGRGGAGWWSGLLGVVGAGSRGLEAGRVVGSAVQGVVRGSILTVFRNLRRKI